MVCDKCKDAFKWLDSLGQHYQPIYGFEDHYLEKGKIKPERVFGFNQIKNNILEIVGDMKNKRILDIGSNLGWFCFTFDEMGADCTGLDVVCRRIDVCEAVKDKMGLKDHPYFWCKDSIEFVLDENPDAEYDYVLLLNTFHHILVQDEERAWAMFNHLLEKSKGIIIMMRSALRGWRLKYPSDIPKSILEQSDATHFKTYDRIHGRTIYFFYKSDEEVEEEDEELLVSTNV